MSGVRLHATTMHWQSPRSAHSLAAAFAMSRKVAERSIALAHATNWRPTAPTMFNNPSYFQSPRENIAERSTSPPTESNKNDVVYSSARHHTHPYLVEITYNRFTPFRSVCSVPRLYNSTMLPIAPGSLRYVTTVSAPRRQRPNVGAT